MQKRGRKSGAEIAVAAPVSIIRRPDAPLELTPDETEEWVAIVDTMPADWFTRETHGLLRQYCRHVVMARRIAQLIDTEMARDEIDYGALDKLGQMQARETAAIKAMSASMRISQQASYTAKSAATGKNNRTTKRPWE